MAVQPQIVTILESGKLERDHSNGPSAVGEYTFGCPVSSSRKDSDENILTRIIGFE